MMALAGVELETLVFKPDALTTRPPPCARQCTPERFSWILKQDRNLADE